MPVRIQEYYKYRHELTEQDGLVYKAQNIVIPQWLRADTLIKLIKIFPKLSSLKMVHNMPRESLNTFWMNMVFNIQRQVPPTHKSGGMHEKAVQIVKNILEKCSQDEQDPYLALLDYRNTPIDRLSPSEALMGQKLRSNIPTSTNLLRPNNVNHRDFKNQQVVQQQKQKMYYNRTAKPLRPLQKGDSVTVQLKPNSTNWKPTKVIACHNSPRSYVVQTENSSEYRTNW